jgi:hypothetical protein
VAVHGGAGQSENCLGRACPEILGREPRTVTTRALLRAIIANLQEVMVQDEVFQYVRETWLDRNFLFHYRTSCCPRRGVGCRLERYGDNGTSTDWIISSSP